MAPRRSNAERTTGRAWGSEGRASVGASATICRGTSDEELAAALSSGEEHAFTLLYEQYGLLAQNQAFRLVGDRGRAEDVVQERVLNNWHRHASFDPARGSFRSWLLTSIHHRAISRLRGKAGRSRFDYPLDLIENSALGDDPWPVVETSLLQEAIQRGLATLPHEQRRAIELAYFAGHSRPAIAEALGISVGTVKGRLRIGLGKLRLALADPAMLPSPGAPPAAPPS